MIRLHVLGGLTLTGHDGGRCDAVLAQPKPLALLVYLAVAPATGLLRRDELLALFWPELETARGRRALSQALFVLRSNLGAGSVVSRGTEEVGLDSSVVWADAVAFRAAAERESDDDAMALYQGELLPAFHLPDAAEFDQWLDRERTAFRQRAAGCAWRLTNRDANAGDLPRATSWARRALAIEPYDERVLRRLLTLLRTQGDNATAIREFDAFADRLRRDLDVEPSDETLTLIRAIRTSAVRPEPLETAPGAERAVRVAMPTPATPNAASSVASHPPARRRLWRRAALFALPVAGVLGARAIGIGGSDGSVPSLTRGARQRVIVADFGGVGRDSTLARTVAELVTVDLSRSPAFEVLSPSTLHSTLQLMRRDTLTPLTSAVAREIAERERVGAVIEGDVRRVGPAYVLSARLVNATTGALLKGWRSDAADSAHIIGAINRLSDAIRRDAGEPLASITTSSSLYRVSTVSLEALRLHVRAEDALYHGDLKRSAALLEDAIRIDSSFADAQVLLATVLGLAGVNPARQVEAIRTAYGYRNRLTPAERYEVTAAYELRVRGDLPAAIAALRNHAELAPHEVFWAVYGGQLIASGDFEGAARELTRGIAFAPTPAVFSQLAVARAGLGDLAGARTAISDGLARYPGTRLLDRARVELAVMTDGYAAADSVAHDLSSSLDARTALTTQALVDAVRGKTSEALEHLHVLAEAQRSGRATGDLSETVLLTARLRLSALGDTARAVADAERALRAPDVTPADPRDRPWVAVAHLYAEAGRARQAAAVLAEYDRTVPEDFRAAARGVEVRTRAMIDVLEGRRAAGIEHLQTAIASGGISSLAAMADLAWVYERVGAVDSAAVAWRRYVETPYMRRLDPDAFVFAAARRRVPDRVARLDRR